MKNRQMSIGDMPSYQEADLDLQIKILIGKIVAGEETPQERAKLEELMQLRQKFMRSPVFDRIEKLRKMRLQAG